MSIPWSLLGRDPVGRQVIPSETKLKHQAVTLEAPTHKPERRRGGLEDQGRSSKWEALNQKEAESKLFGVLFVFL